MLIEIVRVNITDGTGGKTPYKLAEVVYKVNDQIKTNRVASFNKGSYAVVEIAKPGDMLEVTFEKNAKGFWEMTSATQAGKAPAGGTTAAATGSGRSGSWETPEERAARQIMIVRQSSLSTAAAVLKAAKPAEVIAVAKEFEAYVLGTTVQGDVI